MNVVVDNGMLRVFGAPVVVVLDGTDWSTRQRDLAQVAIGSAAHRGSEAAVGFLSGTEFLSGLPDNSYVTDCSMRKRGRFLTPLVEAGLLDKAVDAIVVLFIAGRILDWQDWSTEMSDRARSVVFVRTQPDAPAVSQAALDAFSTVDAQAAEQGLRELLLSQDELVELTVTEGWIFEASGALSLGLREGRWAWVLDTQRSALHDIGVAGEAPDAILSLHSNADAEIDVHIPTRPTREADRVVLTSDEAKIVNDALDAYRNGSRMHDCPLCGNAHEFDRALRCDVQDSAFFSSDRSVIVGSLRGHPDGTRFVLERKDGEVVALKLPSDGVAFACELVFSRGPNAEFVAIPAGMGPAAARELETVVQGLRVDRTSGVYVVEI